MTDYRTLEQQFANDIGFERRPVAIAVRDGIPEGVARFDGTVPSGCTFWRLASEGRTFYTVPGDHYNCAIGCYTHNIPLPPEREADLTQTLGLMAEIGYVRMEEVAGIPRLAASPAAVVYAPLGDTPVDPDVVVFAGQPGKVMLLQEAAIRAGVAAQLNTLGRPTCMSIPAAMAFGMVVSTGCIGNRVYTGVAEGDLYAVIPGSALARVVAEAGTIRTANAQLHDYHAARRQQLLSV